MTIRDAPKLLACHIAWKLAELVTPARHSSGAEDEPLKDLCVREWLQTLLADINNQASTGPLSIRFGMDSGDKRVMKSELTVGFVRLLESLDFL